MAVLSQLCLGFQVTRPNLPLSSVSLKHEAAYPCSLDSQSLSLTFCKSVTSFMLWKQQLILLLCSVFKTKMVDFQVSMRKERWEYLAVALAIAGCGDSVCSSRTESISILGGKLSSLYLHSGATSFLK